MPKPKKPKIKEAKETTKSAKVLQQDVPTDIRRFTLQSFKRRRARRKVERRESRTKLQHSFRIFNRSVGIIRRHWEVFGGITLIYLLLNLLLVGGNILSSNHLQSFKDTTVDAAGEELGYAGTGVALYGYLLQAGGGTASGMANAYQTMLLLIFSLIYVWALRQLYAGNAIRVRDALYNATYPLIQVLLVLLMVLLHLLPALLGVFLFSSLVVGGVLVESFQQVIVAILSLSLIGWSAYLVTASVFALYIATLPDMTPLVALRTAKNIVRYRRGTVLRKLIYLPLVLIPLNALVVIPVALIITPLASIFFFIVGTLTVPFVHAYMYNLYRELITDER